MRDLIIRLIYYALVSIDKHPFWVYAADGQFHDPQLVNVRSPLPLLALALTFPFLQVIDLPPGERFQAMIKLDQAVGDYAIRASLAITPQFMTGYGVLSYSPTSTSSQNIPAAQDQALSYGGTTLSGFTELNPLTLKPFPNTIHPPQTATQTIKLELYRLTSLTWSMNMDPFAPYLELAEPLLYQPQSMQDMDQNLVPYYPVGSVVDAVIVLNPGNPMHPLHKHGVKV